MQAQFFLLLSNDLSEYISHLQSNIWIFWNGFLCFRALRLIDSVPLEKWSFVCDCNRSETIQKKNEKNILILANRKEEIEFQGNQNHFFTSIHLWIFVFCHCAKYKNKSVPFWDNQKSAYVVTAYCYWRITCLHLAFVYLTVTNAQRAFKIITNHYWQQQKKYIW